MAKGAHSKLNWNQQGKQQRKILLPKQMPPEMRKLMKLDVFIVIGNRTAF